MAAMRADHPKQRLLAFVVDEADDASAREMESLVEQLSATRAWSIGPPRFVNEVDDSSMSAPDDVPIRTLGALLEVYSTWPPWGELLPQELDRANLSDARAFIDSLVAFSSRTGLQVDLELEDEHVGSIRGGQPDRILRDGFLGEWERGLETRH